MDKPKSEKDVIKSLEENPKPSLPDKNTTINIPPSVKHPAVVELMARIEALEAENERLKSLLTPEKQKQREILIEMMNEPESQEELWNDFWNECFGSGKCRAVQAKFTISRQAENEMLMTRIKSLVQENDNLIYEKKALQSKLDRVRELVLWADKCEFRADADKATEAILDLLK